VDEPGMGRRFAGRVAVVTGASSDPGIGTATVRRLALEGCAVVMNARRAGRLEAASAALRAEGLEVTAVAGSAEDEGVAHRLVDVARRRYGAVDHVVNAVGGASFQGSALQMDRQAYLDCVAMNTWPALALIQAAMDGGLAARDGSIVNISSGSPKKTTPSMAAYAASKAALNALTRTLANDLAGHGVRVNAVSPGLTRTEGTRAIWEHDGGDAAGRHLPLGRLTEPEDVAAAVAFLLSEDARSITGVLLDVDAGNHVAGGAWSPFASPPMHQPGDAQRDGPGISTARDAGR